MITNIGNAETASPTMGLTFGKKTWNWEPHKTAKESNAHHQDLRDDAKLLDLFHAMNCVPLLTDHSEAL